MSKKLTREDIELRVKKYFGEDFSIVSDYDVVTKKVKIYHERCGTTTDIYVSNIRKGRKGCSTCSKKKKYTTDEISKKIEELGKGEYVLLGEYQNMHKSVKILHKKCKTISEITPSNFINGGKRCRICTNREMGIRRRNNHNDFLSKVSNEYLTKYEIVGKYIKLSSKIEVKCKQCNNTWKQLPRSIVKGHGCPNCANVLSKSNTQFKKEIEEKFRGEYTVIGEYKNADTTVEVKHNICNRKWDVRPYHLLSKTPTGCPHCARETSESWLATKYKETFKREFEIKMEKEFPIQIFGGRVGDTVLYPDIVIPSRKLCIEIDGVQHFKYSNFFYDNEEQYKRRILLDRVKDKWFIENGYGVIRVGVGVVRNKEKEIIAMTNIINDIKKGKDFKGVTFVNYPNKRTWRIS